MLLTLGYERQGGYQFEAKKLRAYSFIHPDPCIPKIFCSELLTDQLSHKSHKIIARYTLQIKPQELDLSVFWSALYWDMPSWDDYQSLIADGDVHEIPTCFYEFALRHEDIGNELYQGFVAANADKIFESTSAA